MGILHTCMNVSDADELADWYVHTVGQKFSHATLPESTSIHGISALAAGRSSRTSVRQYQNLDFERSWEFTSGDTRNVYVADESGVEIQLSDTDGEDEFEFGSGWDHLAVKVDDVDATFEDIDHHGVVKEPGDQPAAGARTAFVQDPDGHVIELIEPLED